MHPAVLATAIGLTMGKPPFCWMADNVERDYSDCQRVERKYYYTDFANWCTKNGYVVYGKHWFYDVLRDYELKSNGLWCYPGLHLVTTQENNTHPLSVRAEVLREAEKMVCGHREQDYGTPEDNFGKIAQLWEAYLRNKCVAGTDVTLLPEDVALMMCLFKIARIATGTGTKDSFVDLAGYAACAAEVNGGNEK